MRIDRQNNNLTDASTGGGDVHSVSPSSNPQSEGLDKLNLKPVFQPLDIETLLAEPEERVPWVVDGYLARGSLTLLAGPPKLGKTTLAYDAITAVAQGQPFLGQDVAQAKVLVLGLEEHRRDIVARLRANKGDELSDVNYFFRLTTIRIAGLAGSIYGCSFQVLLIRSSGPRVAHALSRNGDLLGLSRRTGEKSTLAFAPGAPISG